MRKLLLSSLLFLCVGAAQAQRVAVDSAVVAEPARLVPTSLMAESTSAPCWQQWVAPSALLAGGLVVTHQDWGRGVRNEVRRALGKSDGASGTRIDDGLQFLPYAAAVGLAWTGLPARHDFRDRTALTLTTFAVSELLTRGLKAARLELRPDGSDWNSFPSGHSARAFAGAELVRREYGWPSGLVAYGVATSVGLLRIYNDRHWAGDVLAGAGIGLLSVNVAYLLLPLEQRLWGGRSGRSQAVLLPTYDATQRAVGLGFVAQF
ncbi:MAG: phosphatase PAP2 family protein [Bacteroidaceae bacterium]|nr:phosphatase PAP2 family protein [Bacteroidaceae bacterium]